MKPQKVRNTIANNKFGIQHNSLDVIFSRLQISFSLETEKAAFAETVTRHKLSMNDIIPNIAISSFPVSPPKTEPIREKM